jgi:hypothetical protein
VLPTISVTFRYAETFERDVNTDVTRDRLTLLSTLTGLFLIAVVLVTLAGQPWQYVRGTAIGAVQVFGAVVALGIGVGTVWLALNR